MAQVTRNQVFISYSHKDQDWLEKLQTMMSPLVRNQTVSVWWDGKIKPGQKWRDEINKALASAKVAVLLVSPNFLASDFINQNELSYLLNAVEQHHVKLIWVLARSCLYKQTSIAEYQAAHDISKPLNNLSEAELDNVLVEICEKLEETYAHSFEPPTTAKRVYMASASSRKSAVIAGQEQRLRQRIHELQSHWELLSQKLVRIKDQYALENRTEEQFRLEHVMADTEAQRDQVEQELRELEAELSTMRNNAAKST